MGRDFLEEYGLNDKIITLKKRGQGGGRLASLEAESELSEEWAWETGL